MPRKAVKKVKNAILYDDGVILVSNVRFSYPHLKRPYKGDNDQGEAKYGVVGLLGKKTHKEAKALIEAEIEKVLKANKLRTIAPDKKFLRDGDESDKEESHGNWTVSAREKRRPILRDADKEPVEPDQDDFDEIFYGGMFGSILIEPWYQNNKFGKRVNASLRAARKLKDGEPFGEGRITEEEVDEAFEDDDGEIDGEEDTPRRGSSKRNRYEDEDEDEKPRRRRRPADDDDDDDL